MITPNILKQRSEESSACLFEKAMQHIEKAIEEELAKGRTELMLTGFWVDKSIAFSCDEREEWLAKQLRSRGFTVERKSYMHQGVRQHPNYYLIF